MVPCRILDLGRLDYLATHAQQKALVEARAAGTIPDTLILVEHDAVITRGRKSRDDTNLRDVGETPVIAVERGGDVTWHGPGQLVAYPIFALAEGERDAPGFIRRLEQWLITALATLGVEGAQRRSGYAGVWVGERKLASIGIAVTSTWITWHGVALNVNPDLREFARIAPCGLNADVMTSVAELTGTAPSHDIVVSALVGALPEGLGRLC